MKDIVQQISEMYSKKRVTTRKEYLVPTKATLFGLDVRFRAVDQKLQNEKFGNR